MLITPKLDRMFRSALNALDVLGQLKNRGVSLHMIVNAWASSGRSLCLPLPTSTNSASGVLQAALAPVAAHLITAERHRRIGRLVAIDPDRPGAQTPGEAMGGGAAITLLAGGHVGCFELFGNEAVHSIADLKGKSVGVQVKKRHFEARLHEAHRAAVASYLAGFGVASSSTSM